MASCRTEYDTNRGILRTPVVVRVEDPVTVVFEHSGGIALIPSFHARSPETARSGTAYCIRPGRIVPSLWKWKGVAAPRVYSIPVSAAGPENNRR